MPLPILRTDAAGGVHAAWADAAPAAFRVAYRAPVGEWVLGEHSASPLTSRLLRDALGEPLLFTSTAQESFIARWRADPRDWEPPQPFEGMGMLTLPVESRHGLAMIQDPTVRHFDAASGTWSPPTRPGIFEEIQWPPRYASGARVAPICRFGGRPCVALRPWGRYLDGAGGSAGRAHAAREQPGDRRRRLRQCVCPVDPRRGAGTGIPVGEPLGVRRGTGWGQRAITRPT
jgi:hypothetical protein